MKKIDLLSNQIRISIIIFSILLTFCSSPVESNNLDTSNDDLEKILLETELEDLSEGEINGLLFMREEEKLARDVYIKLYELWNVKTFDNISKSEQKHTDAVKLLLDRYSITDPVVNDEIGVFVNVDLQKLYDNLFAEGSSSLLAALKVGAAIEEIDILDLEKQLEEVVDNKDVSIVYGNLLRGSKNHLRAFVRNINSQGEIYAPQYMEQEDYNTIINAEMEKGNKGKGKRKGNRSNN